MSAGRVVATVIGALIGLLALGLVLAGGAMLFGYGVGRDADGFLESDEYVLDTHGHAITGERIEILTDAAPGEWLDVLGDGLTARVTATPTDGAVFIGIGPRDDVEAYLSGVAHTRVTEIVGEIARTTEVRGDDVPAAPTGQELWVASTSGEGTQQLEWDVASGTWSVVLMRPDGSADLAVTSSAAVTADPLLPIGTGLLLGGLVLLAVAGIVVMAAARGTAAGVGAPAAPAAPLDGPYPVRVEAELDEPLSRGLWLVKWLFALPHAVVLAFLWLAVPFTTLAAAVAILFTGRYPAGLFGFHTGVLRWTWRVGHYAYATIGTDRYPPFALGDRTYPARLEVVPPARLSRWQVLVKSWLLALPHLVIVGFFTGGLFSWTVPLEGNAELAFGGGLIGLLVLVAGVLLLFTGRYPQGLFDLLMGLNRWTLRVAAYVLLMTDDYPPFRLDGGGTEPPAGPSSPGRGPSEDQRQLTGV